MSDQLVDRRAERRAVPRTPAAIVACIAVAILSMWALPGTLSFDPWAWVVWGREVADGSLDTTGGPSWKPFPVLLTAPLSVFGDAAPTLWMVVARTGGLLTMVLTARLALRLCSRIHPGRSRVVTVAGALAGVVLVLTPDGGPRWLRVVGEGHADPLAAGFVLLAIDRHLATESGQPRYRHALLALGAASLIRPEAWPLLLAYGLWAGFRARTGPHIRSLGRWIEHALAGPKVRVNGLWTPVVPAWVVLGVWLTVPVLWFGGDLWGSGDFWHGADAAQVGPSSIGSRLWLLGRVIAGLVPVPVWALAAVAAALAWRRRDGIVTGVAAIAVAWASIVSTLTVVLGYAALRRFFFPTVTLTCVLAAVGLIHVIGWMTKTGEPAGPLELRQQNGRRSEMRRRLALGVVAGIVSLALMTPRIISIGERRDEVLDRRDEADDLERVVDATVSTVGGEDALYGCGPAWIEGASLLRPMLPWLLDLPLHDVTSAGEAVKPGVMFAPRRGPLMESLDALASERRQVVASSEHWTVVAVDCGDPPTK